MRIYETTYQLIGFCLIIVLCSGFMPPERSIFMTRNGTIHFTSDAPLELIEASSDALRGAIDLDQRTFAFTVEMSSFDGFNSPLQRTHFNENYMESKEYRQSTFIGKIIEKTDISKPGKYTIRAKGKLKIHGRTRERIIKSEITVSEDRMVIKSYFTVLLQEHDITIPKIVHQKIAEEIQVHVEGVLYQMNQ